MVSCPSTCSVWQCSGGCGYVLVCTLRRASVQARGWGRNWEDSQGCLVAQSLWELDALLPVCCPRVVPSYSSPNTGQELPHPLVWSTAAQPDEMQTVCQMAAKLPSPPSARGLQMKWKPRLPRSCLPENLRRQTLLLELNHPVFCQTNTALHCHHKLAHRHGLIDPLVCLIHQLSHREGCEGSALGPTSCLISI